MLEHDLRELYFIETTLRHGGRTDILLVHEPTLSRGLRLLQACRVQLILVDSALPGGSLREILGALRRQTPGTPIVILQGHGSRDPGVAARRAAMRRPRGVRAVVARRDGAGLLEILDATLGT